MRFRGLCSQSMEGRSSQSGLGCLRTSPLPYSLVAFTFPLLSTSSDGLRRPTQELATALTEGPPLLAEERKSPLFLKGKFGACRPSHDLKWFLTSGAAYSEEGLRMES